MQNGESHLAETFGIGVPGVFVECMAYDMLVRYITLIPGAEALALAVFVELRSEAEALGAPFAGEVDGFGADVPCRVSVDDGAVIHVGQWLEHRVEPHLIGYDGLFAIDIVHADAMSVFGCDERVHTFFPAVLAHAGIQRAGAPVGRGVVLLGLHRVGDALVAHEGAVETT